MFTTRDLLVDSPLCRFALSLMACCLQVRLYTPPDLSEQQTLYQTVYHVVLGHQRMLHPDRQQVGRVLRKVIARRMYIR